MTKETVTTAHQESKLMTKRIDAFMLAANDRQKIMKALLDFEDEIRLEVLEEIKGAIT